MWGPQIRLRLFTFRPIVLKWLNRLTTIDTLSWLGGAEVTHQLWVREVPGSIPSSGKGFYVWFFVLEILLFVQKHIICHNILQINFAMLIYLVFFTYRKICDQLKGYIDTDLASLILGN